jgi:hypothetical protein
MSPIRLGTVNDCADGGQEKASIIEDDAIKTYE